MKYIALIILAITLVSCKEGAAQERSKESVTITDPKWTVKTEAGSFPAKEGDSFVAGKWNCWIDSGQEERNGFAAYSRLSCQIIVRSDNENLKTALAVCNQTQGQWPLSKNEQAYCAVLRKFQIEAGFAEPMKPVVISATLPCTKTDLSIGLESKHSPPLSITFTCDSARDQLRQ